MTATAWQRTAEWEADPNQPREQVLTVAIDTARNGEAILLVSDGENGDLIGGAAIRSQSDLEEAINVIASQLNYAVARDKERRSKPTSRLLNRGSAGSRW